jgi:hypothetical protein
VSFLKYLFDTDYAQRRDIEELREERAWSSMAPSGSASERWVSQIADEVKELAATVRVMTRMLAEAGALDVAKLRDEVAAELAPKPARPDRPARPAEPSIPVSCSKCGHDGRSDDMVKVGAAWFCRPCARNP